MRKKLLTSLCAAVMAVSILLCDNSISVVKADTVDNTQTTESTETTAFTVTKYDKAITRYVTASKIATYSEPTTSSEKTGTLAFQKKVKLTGEVTAYNGKTLKTKWYQLSTGAYIKDANLSETKPELVAVSKYKKAKTLYAKKNNTKIYKYPSTAKKSKTVCKLSKGTKIKVVGKVTKYAGKKTSGTWYRIKLSDGTVGYVSASLVSKTKTSSSSSGNSSSGGSSSSSKNNNNSSNDSGGIPVESGTGGTSGTYNDLY